ncbi:alpha/beta hydrolase [Comamonas badia]|jgi:acetyl esterase|uniref:alpha/beta hydrolase n=1 Tax=Comamonas badia TaxID=265291 RepID=UPI000413652E|nr:alpha/beta hydrolase [Comamonas badia]
MNHAPAVFPDLPLAPQMRAVVQGMARAARPPLHTLTPQAARAAYAAGSGVLEITPAKLARVEELAIPARDGALMPARLYGGAQEGVAPVLLYLHGGGFTIGSIATHDVLCRELAHLSGAAVLSLEYRLAPEHRFPVASNDTWDALAWLSESARNLWLDPARIAIGGDSAGGTLAAAGALMARDAGLQLALQLLFYPGTAAHQETASHARFAHGPILGKAEIDWFFANYIDESQREDWRFAPLLAPDVDGVAPAWIGLAELDPLVDEGIAWADRLRMAGVAVDLDIYRGVTHEFIKMGRALPQARQAHRDAARALRKAFGLEQAP